jgi:N utilization substance protein B
MASKRRRAREMALQMLYQSDLGGASCSQIFSEFRPIQGAAGPLTENGSPAAGAPLQGTRGEQAFAYAKNLVEGTLAHREEIDTLIRSQAEHWRLERMPAVDRNILRLAVYEFLYETDVPKLVVLDEAIELAKEYGTEQSGRFVNGLLDGILKGHTLPGTLT